ncbi:PAS domain-containing protein [Streptomyces sp. NPDC002896]|uniref:PAS domain-containing protein n=1 Tax=Streptomyces sp. NPDC002896 TaxID=3154438 RepID=UPI003324020F
MSSRPSRGAARLAAILDALPDALVLVNANGTVVNANTIALRTFEAPGTALVGRGLLDLLPEFDSRLIPGSMRRPDSTDAQGRTKPTRMIARRTDGTEFPVEVSSANLENGQQAYDGHGYTGDELLMLVVRDLTGTVDTEAELARSQRQTEMILRAAAEGVVGTDTEGRVVLVNPAAAQILGFRAGDLGGQALHALILHSRADGEPFPYEESPLADTLRSGRKHRVRGQVLWSKSGGKVPVDLTTSPVRDGDQLVGAVMTFTDRRPYEALAEEKEEADRKHAEEQETAARQHAEELAQAEEEHAEELAGIVERHAEELAGEKERYAALAEREKDRFEELTARHEQLLAVLGGSLRGPLEELRRELSTLAADDAGQLWPEANQVLHHLAAGYARITTLVDNVLAYQQLDEGAEQLVKRTVMLDGVVAAGVEGAIELIGPGRAQFAVHAPPLEAEVDPERLATALAHLVADVAGVDATGNAPVSAAGYMDSTVVVAAAQRGEVVRIEVRGPYSGGDPVHQPIVQGIVRAHGGVLQTHEVPGMSGCAYVLEVPIGGGAGTVQAAPAHRAAAGADTGTEGSGAAELGTGSSSAEAGQAGATAMVPAQATVTGGRRRARRASVDAFLDGPGGPGESSESGVQGAGTDGSGSAADGGAVPTGRRRGRRAAEPADAKDPVQPQLPAQASGPAGGGTGRRRGRPSPAEGAVVTAAEHAAGSAALGETVPPQGVPVPTGRRARRDAEQRALPALPAASAGATTQGTEGSGEEPAASAGVEPGSGAGSGEALGAVPPAGLSAPDAPGAPGNGGGTSGSGVGQPAGRRARRALAGPTDRAAAQEAPRAAFALPPAEADRSPGTDDDSGQHATALHDPADDHTPPQPHPTSAPTGRRRARPAAPAEQEPNAPQMQGQQGVTHGQQVPMPVPGALPGAAPAAAPMPGAAEAAGAGPGPATASGVPTLNAARGQAAQLPQAAQHTQAAQPALNGQAVPPGQPEKQATLNGQSLHGPSVQTAQSVPTAQPWTNGATPASGMPVQDPDAGHDGQPMPAPSAQPGRPTPSGPDGQPAQPSPAAVQTWPNSGTPAAGVPAKATPDAQQPQAAPAAQPAPPQPAGAPTGPTTRGRGVALPPQPGTQPRAAQPLPAEAPAGDANSPQGRAISVRTLGQGVPFGRQIAEQQRSQGRPGAQPAPGLRAPQPLSPASVQTPQAQVPRQAPAPGAPAQASPGAAAARSPQLPAQQPAPVHQQQTTPPPANPTGSGRRRKLATPPDPSGDRPETAARPHPGATGPAAQPQSRLATSTEGSGRSYAIGAPDEDADEGPEPLDGPGGAVEVADQPVPQPMDDELPPEPLDNPRRLLVWPAPDVSTQQALSDRGYRPVIVHSREEVDAQIAAFPAALFVDPLTGPITRTALQSLRQAAVAAEVPVLVTAGLGQATREAAYGADPAVLLKALAPRDSEQHPPRVLLIEEHAEIALALTATLERRGMQVARAENDADAVTLAAQMRPNLVVMDLMQVRRRRSGIVDWLRANGQLNRTPLVVYTAAVDQAELPRLAAGETVLFLAERSTSDEVQNRIVDLLARIGTN